MEISKGLQQEIQLVQSKLKNAIRDHQICVGKLKDDPDNADVLGRIQEIQLHIVSLGRCQKQVVQRLRKEVEAFKADNANDVKVSFASLLGLNNNNHITANNEATTDEISEVKVVTNGLDSGRHAKEDYEEIVRNGDVITSPRENLHNKERSVSVETVSAEDEIMEVEVDENSRETRHPDSEERLDERNINFTAQLDFLEILGLITTSKFTDLQNKRAERKRRSTANPQFVYSNWEIPTKRKRHNYLQSAGNVPQTRQTTARLNGPSPPPSSTNNKTAATVVPPKSTSPPTRTIVKSLIPTQKATTRPNILRNMSESRIFINKGRIENGNGQMQSTSNTKVSQQSNSKTVHIPGLPSGLTIERIENDSAVCINCRNPGTLTNCDNCEANYHVSCHTISPPPPRLCPKCAVRLKDDVSTTTIKKNDELVAASYAPGVAGKAGEDPEIDKASCGLYKIGAATKHQQTVGTGSRSVNQLPSSSFLVPISPNTVAPSDSFDKSDLVVDEQSLQIIKSDSNSNTATIADGNELSFNTTLVIGNQFSRSSVTYVPQPESNVPYSYQHPFNNTEISKQPYFLVKIAESGKQTEQTTEAKSMQLATSIGTIDTRGGYEGGSVGGKPVGGEASLQLDKLTGRLAESIARGSKKSATRAIPGLNRIVHADNKSVAFATEHSNDNEIDKLSSNGSYNVGKSTNGEQQRNFAIGPTQALGCSGEIAKSSNKFETSKQNEHRQKSISSRGKRKSEPSARHAMFASYNKSDTIADCSDQSRQRKGRATGTRLDDNNDDDRCELSRDGLRDKHRSQPAPLLHALFASYNKPDNVAERSNELKQHEGNANDALFVKSSDNNEFEPSRNESEGHLSRCSIVAGSTEHVKLEEAHLSAPPRAKLVRDDARMIVQGQELIGRMRTTTRKLSNRRRTTEDRRRTPPLQRALLESSNNKRSKHESNRQMPRILMRPARRSLESRDVVSDEITVFNTSKHQDTLDFASFEKKYSNTFVKIVPGMNTLPEVVSTDTSSTDTDEEALLSTSVSDEILRGAVDKDKAEEDIESKDLISEEQEEVNSDDEIDEEIDDEEEDLDDTPILDEDITVTTRMTDRCNISTVSPESMKVLEQFESAILDTDNGDTTANP